MNILSAHPFSGRMTSADRTRPFIGGRGCPCKNCCRVSASGLCQQPYPDQESVLRRFGGRLDLRVAFSRTGARFWSALGGINRRSTYCFIASLLSLPAASCSTTPQIAMPTLTVAGRPEVLEIGPVLDAARHDAAGRVVIIPGGIPNLFKPPGDRVAVSGDPLDAHAGHAQLAAQSETQALRVSVRNPDLRIILTITEGLYEIVGRRSAGISDLADLRGKRIGTYKGTSAAFFVHRMLRTVGLSERDVIIVPLELNAFAEALAAKEVDAVAIWEPDSTRARERIGPDAIEFSDPSVYRELYNLNTTAAALRDPVMRRRIVAFVRSVIQSSKISARSPHHVQELIAANGNYDLGLVVRAWPRHRFTAALPSDLLNVLEDEEVWLADQEKRKPRARDALERLIDKSILREALAPARR